MKIGHLAASDYIKDEDLQGKQKVVTIQNAEIKRYDDGTEKVVLSFADTDKKLTLNKTRLKTMMALFGDDTDKWMNKQVILTASPLSSGKFAGQWTVVILQKPQEGTDSLGFAEPITAEEPF